jgi:nucleoside-diphosphate-sugar epimerase
MSDSRLLVTGATGFIGSRLALHAHRAGMNIVAAGRVQSREEMARADELRTAGVRLLAGTLDNADHVRTALQGRDTIIHLAAAQHESHMPAGYFREINVTGTRTLLEAAVRTGARRFVYGSSIGVYGSSVAGLLDEASVPRPENIYTQTKLEAEQAVAAFAERIQTCIVRISETYGPSDFRLLKLFRALDSGHFVMLGSGLNRRQCMHVGDLIRVLLLAAEHPKAAGETFVAAGREIMTSNEMVQTIAAAMHRRAPRLHVPLWPFSIAARVMETVLPPIGIQPPLHRRRLDFFSKSFVFSTAKVQSLLGFQPEIDFLNGAADTARWYRARGYLPARMSHEVAESESA